MSTEQQQTTEMNATPELEIEITLTAALARTTAELAQVSKMLARIETLVALIANVAGGRYDLSAKEMIAYCADDAP